MKVMTLAEIEANPIPVIEHYRAAYPWLHWGGFSNAADVQRMGREEFDGRRREMTEASGVGQVLRAARFIDQAPRIKGLNPKRSTYGWKHVAERCFQNLTPGQDYYVGEGSFLIAAWAMGLTVKRDQHGFHRVNLSETAATVVKKQTKRMRAGA
jgi:hypothetical protein